MGENGWTVATYAAHNEALRSAEEKFHQERDRRYAELAIEREKALQIKEDGEQAALLLAREIQTYKDEKANELRAQISNERGLYVTRTDLQAAVEKIDATLQPIKDSLSASRGRGLGYSQSWGVVLSVAALIASLIAIGSFALRPAAVAVQPQMILVPAAPGTLVPTTPQNAPR
jgi:hypothetical protein